MWKAPPHIMGFLRVWSAHPLFCEMSELICWYHSNAGRIHCWQGNVQHIDGRLYKPNSINFEIHVSWNITCGEPILCSCHHEYTEHMGSCRFYDQSPQWPTCASLGLKIALACDISVHVSKYARYSIMSIFFFISPLEIISSNFIGSLRCDFVENQILDGK